MSVEDFHDDVLLKYSAMRMSLLKIMNMSEEQYKKLVSTPEGKEKISSVLQKKPEWRHLFIRLDTIDRCVGVFEKEYDNYLPF